MLCTLKFIRALAVTLLLYKSFSAAFIVSLPMVRQNAFVPRAPLSSKLKLSPSKHDNDDSQSIIDPEILNYSDNNNSMFSSPPPPHLSSVGDNDKSMPPVEYSSSPSPPSENDINEMETSSFRDISSPETEPTSQSTLPKFQITKDSLQFTSSLMGAYIGRATIGGLPGILLGSGILNFASRNDDDFGLILKNVAKNGIESYNYFTELDGKYDFVGVGVEAVKNALDDESAERLYNLQEKVKQLNEEYDLLGKGGRFLEVAGDWIERLVTLL